MKVPGVNNKDVNDLIRLKGCWKEEKKRNNIESENQADDLLRSRRSTKSS